MQSQFFNFFFGFLTFFYFFRFFTSFFFFTFPHSAWSESRAFVMPSAKSLVNDVDQTLDGVDPTDIEEIARKQVYKDIDGFDRILQINKRTCV